MSVRHVLLGAAALSQLLATAASAQTAPPITTAATKPAGSAYLQCDGQPNNMTDGEMAARLLGEVTILGTATVKRDVIMRQLDFIKGEPFKLSALQVSQRRLYGVELFQFANVEVGDTTTTPGEVGIKITVVDAPHRPVPVGLGRLRRGGFRVAAPCGVGLRRGWFSEGGGDPFGAVVPGRRAVGCRGRPEVPGAFQEPARFDHQTRPRCRQSRLGNRYRERARPYERRQHAKGRLDRDQRLRKN